MADRYNCTNDLSLEFHIESKLYQMRQEIGQSISNFYSQTSTMWEQLSIADPPLVCSKDIELFVKYRDRRKFIHFMMGLREDFEPTRASLLSRSPTPSLDAAVKELISEENHWPTHHMSSSDHVLATPSPQPLIAAFIALPRINSGHPTSQSSKGTRCEFCRAKDHDISVCRKLIANCRYLCKSKIKLIFLKQLLYVLQIHQFVQVHLWLPHLLWLILMQ